MTDTAHEAASAEQSKAEDLKAVIRCTFCRKPTNEVKKMVAGPGVNICDQCVSLCVEIIESESKDKTSTETEMPERASWEKSLSDDELLKALPGIAATSAQVERELATWVRTARGRGITWTRIGEAMGMTRQSAWERFSGEE
jgi:hypothetical protein